VDPDPEVLRPPGSGSVIIFKDPNPSIIKKKKIRKTLISSFMTFSSLKTDVNVPSKINRQKNLEKTLIL
jgi:hypothetical protein